MLALRGVVLWGYDGHQWEVGIIGFHEAYECFE